jgi:hypothetical protein
MAAQETLKTRKLVDFHSPSRIGPERVHCIVPSIPHARDLPLGWLYHLGHSNHAWPSQRATMDGQPGRDDHISVARLLQSYNSLSDRRTKTYTYKSGSRTRQRSGNGTWSQHQTSMMAPPSKHNHHGQSRVALRGVAEFVDVRCEPALALTCDCTAPALRLCPAGTVVMVVPETTTTDPPEGRVLCALATGVMVLPETTTTDADDAAEFCALGPVVATPLRGPGFSMNSYSKPQLNSRGSRSLTPDQRPSPVVGAR